MAVARTLEKGHRYVEALDAARCSGTWHEVPDLLKKVSKHTPGKQCLIVTARAEYRIAERIRNASSSTETGVAPTDEDGLLDLIPTLLSAMEADGSSTQEVFQAQVCLGWLHWTLSEPALASSRLPKDFEVTLRMISEEGQPPSPWTEVCIVKGGYIKGSAQALTTGLDDALQTMSSVLPWASGRQTTSGQNPQLESWTERFIAKSALLASAAALSPGVPSVRTFDFAFASFRAWASYTEVKRVPTPTSTSGAGVEDGFESRSSMWKAYLEFLSTILQQGLPYSAPGEGSRRVQLSAEYRRVEVVCENILLRNVKFPKAHTKNQQVEEWVEQVIRNWEILCGTGWSDDDLGEGGQDAVSRNVLDILYRASTKTFHSTLILRRLFHVHAALAEFDLAIKAFDTYTDIVTNAKSRAEHSEKRVDSVEDDETRIRTLSEGIMVLCCFGSRKEAQKANQIASRVEEILSTLNQHGAVLGTDNDATQELVYLTEEGKAVSAAIVSAAYRAVGVGLATWARWTPVNESRSSIQEAAAIALERSLAARADQEPNAATAYAFGLLLAEMRDLDAAIDHVRAGLVSSAVADDASQRSIAYSEDHDLLPLWHLLTLLLSAKQEFEAADGVCDAALDLVSGTSFQDELASRSGHDENEDGQRGALSIGFCNTQSRHKESLLELRMTQLGLTEILHGPEAALNHSDELFSLFGRLFAGLEVTEADAQAQNELLSPPRASVETVKTFRGSIFGRRRKHNKDAQPDGGLQRNGSVAVGRARHGSLRRKRHDRHASLASATKTPAKGHRREDTYIGSSGRMSPTTDHNDSSAARQPLPAVPHNLKYSKEPPPTGHESQPPRQDIRLPPSSRFDSPTKAVTRFPKLQAQKHALGLLIKIWLGIAGLYRRASLFDDAREACNEAAEQASHIEALVAGQESSARALADAGWGGAKSSDELWADVYAERGFLAEAQSQPYEAMKHFEEALMYFQDHPRATVGLANLLLSIYDEALAPEEPEPESEPESDPSSSSVSLVPTSNAQHATASQHAKRPTSSSKDTPEKLNRLAARDRAYGLLSTLTKLGSSWDNSKAWFALSRAYEQGDQVERAKEILWWCVELEDRRPIRHWRNVGSGGYVL